MAAKLRVDFGSYSDKGVKPENQDSLGFSSPENIHLLASKGIACALADGVSSSEEAKQASQCCITGFLEDYFSTPDSWSVKKSGAHVLTAINNWLYKQSSQYQDINRGLASTFSGLVIKSNTAHLFHVGDSRIYLIRDNTIRLLTKDHRIQLPGQREYLARAMGIDVKLDIDYKPQQLEEGDVFLIATDGIHDFLSEQELLSLSTIDVNNLDEAAHQIVDEAVLQGSNDNVSCLLLKINELPTLEPDEVISKLTELPFPPELEEGMILDGYRIIRELHASSTSQLYQAIDSETQEKVVIKTPSVNFEDDPAYLERFQLEEWVGRRIDSPHVIRTIPQKRARQFLYYVMEYIEGKTIEQWIVDQDELDLTVIRNIVSQVCAGLRAFHRLDMLHQDIKPGNIMITNEGLVKIVDFGSTKIAGIAEIATPIQRKTLLGTKHYTAPEYLLGQVGTSRSDMFSLGCVIYEMISKKLPYGDSFSKSETVSSMAKLSYTPLTEHVAEVPHWMDKAIRSAVQINPENRYEKLSELEADLRKPNPAYLTEQHIPLMQRNPVQFWRAVSFLLLISNCVLLYLLR
jgi:serine/threonine protein phosphatase PrpC